VAQFGRASGLGPEGCTFKSCRPDYNANMTKTADAIIRVHHIHASDFIVDDWLAIIPLSDRALNWLQSHSLVSDYDGYSYCNFSEELQPIIIEMENDGLVLLDCC
jgi:hypothetical protein